MTADEQPEVTDPELTNRQRRIVRFVMEFFGGNGYGPSYREIAEAVGLSTTSSVSYQVEQLVKKGLLHRDPKRSRTVVPGQRMTLVPFAGQIAAGYPILAEELISEYYLLPRRMVGEGDLIMLKVKGDSMIDSAIADGDFVVVRRQVEASDGEIVAAMIQNEKSGDFEATVKTLKRVDGHVWLIPHNPAFQPFMADDAAIIGKVVTVLRRL